MVRRCRSGMRPDQPIPPFDPTHVTVTKPDLLVRRGALDQWYDFSNKAEEAALRKWCAENGIELSSI